MKIVLFLGFLTSSILALPSDSATAQLSPELVPDLFNIAVNVTQITDHYLFHTSLKDFIKKRNKRDPPELDWTSDDCTHAPDNPMGFKFEPACQHHDFGIRNYKVQNRFNKKTKKTIDKNFKSECVPSGSCVVERLSISKLFPHPLTLQCSS